ncbi:hypothetical protein ACTMTF_15180 [Nonomuraea sp. ZG12]|uniref:hypothetical protein n=1 Tax=Nonomuraea sp. ZG12 TaxID=3452207 RepID=UPI003F88825E
MRTKAWLSLGIVAGVAMSGCSASDDDLRRSRFYVDGSSAATILTSKSLETTRKFSSCEQGFVHMYEMDGLKDFAKPQSDEDKDAFMLGCNEGLKTQK